MPGSGERRESSRTCEHRQTERRHLRLDESDPGNLSHTQAELRHKQIIDEQRQ
jgi:hypothetical protein